MCFKLTTFAWLTHALPITNFPSTKFEKIDREREIKWEKLWGFVEWTEPTDGAGLYTGGERVRITVLRTSVALSAQLSVHWMIQDDNLKKRKNTFPDRCMQVKPCANIDRLYQNMHWMLTGAPEPEPVRRDCAQVYAGTMIWWEWNVNEASCRIWALVNQDYAQMLTAAGTVSIVILRGDVVPNLAAAFLFVLVWGSVRIFVH